MFAPEQRDLARDIGVDREVAGFGPERAGIAADVAALSEDQRAIGTPFVG
jgi:hypothetical protein